MSIRTLFCHWLTMAFLAAFFCALAPLTARAVSDEDLTKALAEGVIYQAYFGTAAGMQQLLDKGADPNTRDQHGWPLLAAVADRNDAEAFPIARVLILAGADVNAAKGRDYPLVSAVKNNNVPLVAMLVAERANLRVRNDEGVWVYHMAKKLNNPDIIYQLEKRMFEEAQTQQFLTSQEHLAQLASQYAFHHCAFQYLGYYLRSEQDKDANADIIKNSMRKHAEAAAENGERALRYFPDYYNANFNRIAVEQKNIVISELDALISNRNRKLLGVGQNQDMLKRCHLEKTPAFFHAIALR